MRGVHRRATSVYRVRHHQKELGPTESATGRSRSLLSSRYDSRGHLGVALGVGPIPNEAPLPCRTLMVCLGFMPTVVVQHLTVVVQHLNPRCPKTSQKNVHTLFTRVQAPPHQFVIAPPSVARGAFICLTTSAADHSAAAGEEECREPGQHWGGPRKWAATGWAQHPCPVRLLFYGETRNGGKGRRCCQPPEGGTFSAQLSPSRCLSPSSSLSRSRSPLPTPSTHSMSLPPQTTGASGCTWSTARATARLRDSRPPE